MTPRMERIVAWLTWGGLVVSLVALGVFWWLGWMPEGDFCGNCTLNGVAA